MMDWIEINGFLSISEIKEICDYCGMDTDEYYEQLEEVTIFLSAKSGKIYFEYLKQYKDILDINQINWALDNYLELEKELIEEV